MQQMTFSSLDLKVRQLFCISVVHVQAAFSSLVIVKYPICAYCSECSGKLRVPIMQHKLKKDLLQLCTGFQSYCLVFSYLFIVEKVTLKNNINTS